MPDICVICWVKKIAELASERAGSEIAIAPEGFSEKIEKLLDTVSHATETPLFS